MHKLFLFIALFILFSCGTQKETIDHGMIDSKDYPYIEKFYDALRFKANGRLDESAALLKECLEIRQDDDAVYYALSKVELMRGNDVASAGFIEKAAAIDPNNTWYTQELAYMYFETQRFEQSVANFKKLVELEPRNIDWLYGYAEALTRVGKVEEAIDALNRTQDMVGAHPELFIQKHRLYLSRQKFSEAEKELLGALDKLPQEPMIIANLVDFYFKQKEDAKATAMLENLVKADPENGRAHLTLADIYMRQNKMDQAYDELKLAMRSDDVDIDTKMKILISLQESQSGLTEDDFELVDILVEKHPSQAKAHSIKGDFYLEKGDKVVALEAYRKALDFDRNQYPIWNQVLLIEYQSSEYDLLYADSKECLSYFPTISTVYLLNGIASNQLNKFEEAQEVLSVGIELIINDDPMKAEYKGQLADAAFGMGELNEAITLYKEAIKLSPQSNLLKNNFAFKLATYKKELDLATSLIGQVLANSDQASYRDTEGWIFFQKGEFQRAKESFSKAHEMSKGDPLYLEHLGDVEFKLGNTAEALNWWQKAKEKLTNKEILLKKISDKKYYEPVH